MIRKKTRAFATGVCSHSSNYALEISSLKELKTTMSYKIEFKRPKTGIARLLIRREKKKMSIIAVLRNCETSELRGFRILSRLRSKLIVEYARSSGTSLIAPLLDLRASKGLRVTE